MSVVNALSASNDVAAKVINVVATNFVVATINTAATNVATATNVVAPTNVVSTQTIASTSTAAKAVNAVILAANVATTNAGPTVATTNIVKVTLKVHSAIISKLLSGFKNNKNPLQPTEEQVMELKYNKQTSDFLRSLTPYKWGQILEKHKDLLFIGKSKKKIADQELRAGQLAQRILANPKIKNLVMMDGHGRFLLTLIEKLGKRANTLSITVVDINSTVVDWHKYFFPKNVESIEANIFNYEPSDTQMVYMNFCGIGGIKGQKAFANYLAKIKKSPTYTKELFVSFSTARRATYSSKGVFRPDHERADKWLLMNTYPTNTWLSNIAKPFVANKLFNGPQNNFPTYLLKF